MLLENCSLLGTDNVQEQISEHISAPNGGYCLDSARPRKIPRWIALIRKRFSVNKEAYRKQSIELALSGFCLFSFSNLTIDMMFFVAEIFLDYIYHIIKKNREI